VSPSLLVAPKGGRETASSRYRIHDLLPALRASGWTIDLLTASRDRSRRLRSAARDAAHLVRSHDVLLVQRPGRRREELVLLRAAAVRSRVVAIDVDDPMGEQGAAGWAVGAASVALVGNSSLVPVYAGRIAQVHVVPTGLDVSLYDPSDRIDERVVGWIGDGPAYADSLVRMARGVAGAGPPWRLRIVGTLGDDLLEAALSEASRGIDLELVPSIEWESERAVAAEVARFTVGLAPFRDLYGTSFKTVQYLAAGVVPLVEAGGAAEAHARLALGDDAFVVEPGDTAGLAAALRTLDDDRLLSEHGRRARSAAEATYSHELVARQVDSALRRALERA